MKHKDKRKVSRRQVLRITAVAGVSLAMGTGLVRSLISRADLHRVSETRTQMGTLVIVTIVAPELKVAREMVRNAFGQMERLEGILSRHRRDTPLDRLNEKGFIETPPPELVEVMGQALTYSSITDGAFDVTVAPLLELYASHFEASNRPPPDHEVERILESVDYRKVQVDEDAIVLEGSEMKVTLDGIAKGYIVDQTVRALVDDGAERILINAGGDMASGGDGSLEDPWTVGVRDPAEPQGLLANVRLGGECIATSGDYMQAFTHDRRFHHIIDPRTGYSPTQASAVTVVTTSAMEADALSTGIMVLGPVEGFQLMKRLEDTEGMIVTKGGESMTTPGLDNLAV